MPEQPEGSPVGTADMHGGGVTFKDRDGNDVSFEVVRLGTSKELETVKAALDEKARAVQLTIGNNDSLRAQVKDALAKAEESSKAYVAEKETRAAFDADNLALRDKLAHEQSEHERTGNALGTEKEASRDLRIALTTARDDLVAAHEVCADVREELDSLKGEAVARDTALASARAELENLMTVKASLEETNTALEVSQKELCESKEDAAALKAEIHGLDDQICEATGSVLGDRNEMLAEVVTERNTSRQALADLKAELLVDNNNLSAILDVIFKKITP